MHFHPASLLITVAVLIPNLLFLAFPPNVAKFGKPADSLLFTIFERVGQVSCFLLPLFFPLSFSGNLMLTAWIVIGMSLALYYAGWARFFFRGRDYAFLFKPMLGIPVPMAVSPVLVFLVASIVLGSILPAVAATVLGVGHITTSAHERLRIRAQLP